MNINIKLLKEALNIDGPFTINRLRNGDIRISFKKEKRRTRTTRKSIRAIVRIQCDRCGVKKEHGFVIHKHHIIPKSAGGENDEDNILGLCTNCHTGDEGIHQHKWVITEVVPEEKYEELKKRYGRKKEKN